MLILEVEAKETSTTSSYVTVHDISNTGLLIESHSSLLVGEMIEVELPRVGFRMAQILWTSGHFVGCKFTHELTRGALSAALLVGYRDVVIDDKHVGASILSDVALNQSTYASSEKLSLGMTLRVILGLAIIAWIIVQIIVWLISA